MTPIDEETIRRIHFDLQDSYDEELELELHDRHLDAIAEGSGGQTSAAQTDADKHDRQL